MAWRGRRAACMAGVVCSRSGGRRTLPEGGRLPGMAFATTLMHSALLHCGGASGHVLYISYMTACFGLLFHPYDRIFFFIVHMCFETFLFCN